MFFIQETIYLYIRTTHDVYTYIFINWIILKSHTYYCLNFNYKPYELPRTYYNYNLHKKVHSHTHINY